MRKTRWLRWVSAAALIVLAGTDLFGQTAAPAPVHEGITAAPAGSTTQAALVAARRNAPGVPFDPTCCNILQIPASSFNAFNSTWTQRGIIAPGYYYPVSTTSFVFGDAPVTLPEHAVIEYLDLYYDDPDPANDISATLFEFTGSTDPIPAPTEVTSVSSSGSGGKGYAPSPQIAFTVNNNVQYGGGGQLVVEVYIPSFASTDLGFKGVDIWWKPQVSPAPVNADFADVPTSNPYYQFIEALYASAITAGCGGGNFCPDRNITRKEVATWMAKALGLNPLN